MLAIPYRDRILQDERELHQFLLTCQEKSRSKGCLQIVSLSQEINHIDPLAICQKIAQPNQIHFYWENPRKQEAIAGYGTVQSLTIETKARFRQSQQFIQDCQKQIVKVGDLHLPFAGPHFFCSFTFVAKKPSNNSPFPSATIFLPKLQIAHKKGRCVLVANLAIYPHTDIAFTINQLKQQIKTINSSVPLKLHFTSKHHIQFSKNPKSDSSHQFTSAVASALKSIQANKFSKIVLAHALDVTSPEPFKLINSLYNLRKRHPDCYIFSLSNGRGDNFVGASPERLISIQNNQLVTDALAGSAPRGKSFCEDRRLANQLFSSQKERREHQAVSKFITQRLLELGLKPLQYPLRVLRLSNIQHLWTKITAEVPGDINLLDIVAQLHPTPAVAGVPTPIACEEICRYESFERSLYAAPLGWVDYQGNGEFIVGIRSALIRGNSARLYAGAGIVAGSQPRKEFAEVQIKLQAMLKSLI
ncbi:MAG: isochorismate synthase [Spirulinaceae cyanobacterium]